MNCLSRVYSVKRRVLSYFYSKKPVIQTTQDMIGPYFITKMESICLDQSFIRYRVSTIQNVDPVNEKITEPWLWFGTEGEDYTEQIRPFLVAGNNITLDLLSVIFPGKTKWVYLDPVTFKEVEFPVEGITINAAGVETSPQIIKQD